CPCRSRIAAPPQAAPVRRTAVDPGGPIGPPAVATRDSTRPWLCPPRPPCVLFLEADLAWSSSSRSRVVGAAVGADSSAGSDVDGLGASVDGVERVEQGRDRDTPARHQLGADAT